MGKYSRRQIDNIFFSYFYQILGFDIAGKLSPYEKIYIKCQSLFVWKKVKETFQNVCYDFHRIPSVKLLSRRTDHKLYMHVIT